MFRSLAITAFALVFTLSASAQEKAKTEEGAEIVFETEIHDFGTIEYGADGTYAFKFTNTGKEPLLITDAKGSCGCTVPKWPKEPVMRGQSNVINVSYDTKRVGPFTKTVTINSNAKSAVKILTIKGNVLSKEQAEELTPVRSNSGMSPLEKSSK